jgi:hypothetical protein
MNTHHTPGLEATELNEPDSGLALLEHFGITPTDFADTEPAPELALLPIERDEVAAAMQAWRAQMLRHILGERK